MLIRMWINQKPIESVPAYWMQYYTSSPACSPVSTKPFSSKLYAEQIKQVALLIIWWQKILFFTALSVSVYHCEHSPKQKNMGGLEMRLQSRNNDECASVLPSLDTTTFPKAVTVWLLTPLSSVTYCTLSRHPCHGSMSPAHHPVWVDSQRDSAQTPHRTLNSDG